MGFGQNFEKYFFGLKTCLKLLETILDRLGIVFSDFYFFKKMSHFFQVLAHRAPGRFLISLFHLLDPSLGRTPSYKF